MRTKRSVNIDRKASLGRLYGWMSEWMRVESRNERTNGWWDEQTKGGVCVCVCGGGGGVNERTEGQTSERTWARERTSERTVNEQRKERTNGETNERTNDRWTEVQMDVRYGVGEWIYGRIHTSMVTCQIKQISKSINRFPIYLLESCYLKEATLSFESSIVQSPEVDVFLPARHDGSAVFGVIFSGEDCIGEALAKRKIKKGMNTEMDVMFSRRILDFTCTWS